jgi:hypothetical protein
MLMLITPFSPKLGWDYLAQLRGLRRIQQYLFACSVQRVDSLTVPVAESLACRVSSAIAMKPRSTRM